jgi:hypothetical protein
MGSFPQPACLTHNKVGALTHALAGTGMPGKNAFGTPSDGRASKAAFPIKLPVLRDSSRSRELLFCFLVQFIVPADEFVFTTGAPV